MKRESSSKTVRTVGQNLRQTTSRAQDLLRKCSVGLNIHSISSARTALASTIVRRYSGLLDKISVFRVVNLLGP